MRITVVFDEAGCEDEEGRKYRIGEFIDSDVQPVFLAYRDRNGDTVCLIDGEWSADELVDALADR
jgi:hypothetical protein